MRNRTQKTIPTASIPVRTSGSMVSKQGGGAGFLGVTSREQLDQRQADDEPADVGEVGDSAGLPGHVRVASCPTAGRNWSANQIPSMTIAGISTRVTKKMMKISVSTRACG